MVLYLYSAGWSERLKVPPQGELSRGEALLRDEARLGEAIAGYQEGSRLPHFARLGPDLEAISALTQEHGRYWHYVVIGNGGSIRNVWALYKAIFEGREGRKVRLLDSTDPSGLLGSLLKGEGPYTKKNTLILPVSKSGTTANVLAETKALLSAGYPALVITPEGETPLYGLVRERGLPHLAHPVEVGGRFTANHNNCLLPLALVEGRMGAVKRISEGFRSAYAACAPSVPLERNMAKSLALELLRAELAGLTEIFVPVYCKALSGLGELMVQLVHETFGKGGKGLTLLCAEAPESQHHTNQRYFGGRKNIAGLSIGVGSFEEDPPLPEGPSCGEFLELEHRGVVEEAEEQGIPHMVLTLERLSPEDVAAAIGLWQWVVVYSALLRGVNPFDQPAVEGSKRRTLGYLASFAEEGKGTLGRFMNEASLRMP